MAVMRYFLDGAYSSTQFTCRDGTLSAFHSDLCGPLRAGRPLYRQIYDDACDVGLAVRSERTRTTIKYYLHKEHTREGDVTHWEFHPCYDDVRRFPECERTKVLVWNT